MDVNTRLCAKQHSQHSCVPWSNRTAIPDPSVVLRNGHKHNLKYRRHTHTYTHTHTHTHTLPVMLVSIVLLQLSGLTGVARAIAGACTNQHSTSAIRNAPGEQTCVLLQRHRQSWIPRPFRPKPSCLPTQTLVWRNGGRIRAPLFGNAAPEPGSKLSLQHRHFTTNRCHIEYFCFW